MEECVQNFAVNQHFLSILIFATQLRFPALFRRFFVRMCSVLTPRNRLSASDIQSATQRAFSGLSLLLLSAMFGCVLTGLNACAPAALTTTAQRSTGQKSVKQSSPISASVVSLPPVLADSLQYQPGKARDYFIKGATLQMQERAAEAILEFQQALRYDNVPAIHFAIAQNYVKLNKQDLALEELRTAITQDSSFTLAYKLLGELYVQQFRVDEAITVYQYLDSRTPETMNRFMLARLYELRDVDKAIALYNVLLQESDDSDAMILARLADLYSQKGNSAKALECLEKLQQTSPDNQAVLFTLMDAYMFQKKYEQGLQLFIASELVITDNDAVSLAVRYANGLLTSFDQSLIARTCADKLLERLELKHKAGYATSWQVQIMCGLLSGHLERNARSSAYFDRALTLADSIPEVPLQICAYYFQKQRVGDMLRVAEQAAKRFPNNGQVYFLWGLGLSQSDSAARAISVLQQAVKIDTNNLDAWNQLAILQNSAGNLRASDAAYERALQIDPNNALANNNYAYSLSERNLQLDRAQTMIENALKAEPKNPSYLDTMGWILYQRGNYKQAVNYILQAIDNGEVSATIYEHLGDAYQKLGDKEKAVQAWREALRKEPNRHSAKERLSNGTATK
jgi:tetratricopeptide (TPR) repeat protein